MNKNELNNLYYYNYNCYAILSDMPGIILYKVVLLLFTQTPLTLRSKSLENDPGLGRPIPMPAT